MRCIADQVCNGSADLDAFTILWCGEGAGIRSAFRRGLAGPVFVSVKVINPDLVERVQVVMAHGGVREAIKPGAVGDEGDDALAVGVSGDAAFGNAEEADVEIVQTLALWCGQSCDGCTVGGGKVAFFFDLRDTGVSVIGRVAEDDEDGAVLLDVIGSLALLLHFDKNGLGMRGRDPAGEGVGEEDAGTLLIVERGVGFFKETADLHVGDDEGRGHDLEAEDAIEGSGAELGGDECSVVASLLD